MSTATPFPWSEPAADSAGTGFRSIFEHAPIPAARCNRQGAIIEMNPALEKVLERDLIHSDSLQLHDLLALGDSKNSDSVLHDVLDGARRSARMAGGNARGTRITHWNLWRVPASGKQPAHVLLMAEHDRSPEEDLLQAQRWEAVGRLAGGVAHDFNNLLTGVMLYCDLLLASLGQPGLVQSSLDQREARLRRYAKEIRAAIVQATGMVRQLLVFARPKATEVRALCLNQVAQAMHDLLTRLIGENIALELQLDRDLGLVKIDQAQAQQILLNLILNARDALPDGGRIVVETSNCKFQTVTGAVPAQPGTTVFPCVLLMVSDNGCGMDAKTRQRLFEPFFTTKSAGKGTGLGLTTIRSIVTTYRGLIDVESEAGRGTRVMILLPRVPAPTAEFPLPAGPHCDPPSTTFQEVEKESLL